MTFVQATMARPKGGNRVAPLYEGALNSGKCQ
jgi:hypothetical protein